MSRLCRLEKRRADGTWELMHWGVGLLNPGRYVERLAARGIEGRATELNEEDLSPTGTVWGSTEERPECESCLGTICGEHDKLHSCIL